ncbi:hypothetical protein HY024_00250 [Candidatus Curtissbacteria bacterium]|nr:hypothetical protein [Candidatus Curtissbacteria bacterium]
MAERQLIDLLSPTPRAEYGKVSEQLRNARERLLARTQRIIGNPVLKPLAEVTGFRETNRDHVALGMRKIVTIRTLCPTLATELDFDVIEPMFFVHDDGEMSLKVDVPAYGPGRDSIAGQQAKLNEIPFAILRAFPRLKDPALQQHYEELFCRYYAQDKGDGEAVFAKLIDRIVGSADVNADHVTRNWVYLYDAPPVELTTHVVCTTAKLLDSARALWPNISADAQKELYPFVEEAFIKIENSGFAESLAPQRERLITLNS